MSRTTAFPLIEKPSPSRDALTYVTSKMPISCIPYYPNANVPSKVFIFPLIGISYANSISNAVQEIYFLSSLNELFLSLTLLGFNFISSIPGDLMHPYKSDYSVLLLSSPSGHYLIYGKWNGNSLSIS